jgi:hypothetical protein
MVTYSSKTYARSRETEIEADDGVEVVLIEGPRLEAEAELDDDV